MQGNGDIAFHRFGSRIGIQLDHTGDGENAALSLLILVQRILIPYHVVGTCPVRREGPCQPVGKRNTHINILRLGTAIHLQAGYFSVFVRSCFRNAYHFLREHPLYDCRIDMHFLCHRISKSGSCHLKFIACKMCLQVTAVIGSPCHIHIHGGVITEGCLCRLAENRRLIGLCIYHIRIFHTGHGNAIRYHKNRPCDLLGGGSCSDGCCNGNRTCLLCSCRSV